MLTSVLVTLIFNLKVDRTIENKNYKLWVWDTAGQEKYRSIIKNYYRDSHGVLLMYDISDYKSFKSLDYYMKSLELIRDETIICLIGNKTDRDDRKISTMEGLEYAKMNNINLFFETSVKYNKNVTRSFECMFEAIYEKKFKFEENTTILDRKIKENKNCVC